MQILLRFLPFGTALATFKALIMRVMFLGCGCSWYWQEKSCETWTEGLKIRYVWNPCDRDPQQEISKTLKSFWNSFKILNIYCGGDNIYFWGSKVYFGGNKVYSRGFSCIWSFGKLFFVAGGIFGTLWVGGSRRPYGWGSKGGKLKSFIQARSIRQCQTPP